MEILAQVRSSKAELLVLLGDNVYADATQEEQLSFAYGALASRAEFMALVQALPMLAAWDDHDYGLNDAGRENPLKQVSKQKMLDFFGEPEHSERRRRAGNYDAVTLGPPGFEVQFILLDTRWFRDPLDRARDPASTLLGEAQWAWLEQTLREPAALRILATSIQFIPTEHPYESWSRFPHERARLGEVLAKTQPEAVVLLSGDRHHAELSCATVPGLDVPLHEFTASSFNRPRPENVQENNPWRVPSTTMVREGNFGQIDIDWSARSLTLRSITNTRTAWSYEIDLAATTASSTCPELLRSPSRRR